MMTFKNVFQANKVRGLSNLEKEIAEVVCAVYLNKKKNDHFTIGFVARSMDINSNVVSDYLNAKVPIPEERLVQFGEVFEYDFSNISKEIELNRNRIGLNERERELIQKMLCLSDATRVRIAKKLLALSTNDEGKLNDER